MMNIKELDKTIGYLQDLRQEEEKKQLDEFSRVIKEELVMHLKSAMEDFESDKFVELNEQTGLECCYSFNFDNIMDAIKDSIKIDVWSSR